MALIEHSPTFLVFSCLQSWWGPPAPSLVSASQAMAAQLARRPVTCAQRAPSLMATPWRIAGRAPGATRARLGPAVLMSVSRSLSPVRLARLHLLELFPLSSVLVFVDTACQVSGRTSSCYSIQAIA